MIRLVLLVLAAFVPAACSTDAAPQAAAEADTLVAVLPVDEAVRDPGFFAFRARLQRAIAARDTTALLAVLDPSIKLSFGDDGGPERFREMWLEPNPRRRGPDVWTRLAEVLALGGRFWNDSSFVAPYTFNPFGSGPPTEGYDAFAALIALRDGVPVLAEARAGADTLAVASFGILTLDWREDGEHYDEGWRAVRLPGDRPGYVRAGDVRSPIDYRAGFVRGLEGWRMTFFIAGD